MVPRPESKHDAEQDCDAVVLPKDRTVNDYDSTEEVREALAASGCQSNYARPDWVLDNYDVDTTIDDPNSIEKEPGPQIE